jgi:DNA-binding Lrp family transcriptional regulator
MPRRSPAQPALDAVDRRLLQLLTGDGRMSVNELAARANVARTTAYARLERLQAEGVITGFAATIDHAKAGLPVAALVLVNIEQHSWPEARAELRRLPGLQHLFLTSGTFDVVLLVRMADIAALRDVILVELHGMRHVRATQTIFVLDEEAVPLPAAAVGASGAPAEPG